MSKLSKYSGKEWRVIGGHKFRFVRAARLKKDANEVAEEYRLKGYKVRVILFAGGYGVFVS